MLLVLPESEYFFFTQTLKPRVFTISHQFALGLGADVLCTDRVLFKVALAGLVIPFSLLHGRQPLRTERWTSQLS